MKIALLSRPDKAVRADTTSSRPRIVYDLAAGLTKNGHEVTVFGSGDSQTPGKLVAVSPIALEKMPPVENAEYRKYSYSTLLIEKAIELSDQFDIIHNHIFPEFLPLLATDRFKAPLITTIHASVVPYMNEAFSHFRNSSFVALSERQVTIGTGVNYVDTVYHGIAAESFTYNEHPQDYLLFLGRMKTYLDENGQEIDPKGVTKAIQVAQMTGEKLLIAGNIEDPQFFEQKIKPHLTDKIQFVGPVAAVGPIGFDQKVELYRNAKALLNPIGCEEAFGLVMVEAMACGTPVISFDRGVTREIVTDGTTGFVVDSVEAMAEAIPKIGQLSRADCRQAVLDRFTVDHMVAGYERAYKKVLGIQ